MYNYIIVILQASYNYLLRWNSFVEVVAFIKAVKKIKKKEI